MLFDGIYSASFLVATRKKATPTITIFILLPLHMIATPGHLKCSAAAPGRAALAGGGEPDFPSQSLPSDFKIDLELGRGVVEAVFQPYLRF